MEIREMLPFMRWFPPEKGSLRSDFMAGFAVSLLLIPQSMAYAQLAGLPAHYGLYGAFVPTMVAALFGWCSQLHTGPVAMTSLLTFALVSQMHSPTDNPEAYLNAVIYLTLIAGFIQLMFGLLRLAIFVNFLSHPVMVGFTNAASLIIISSQIPHLLGISAPQSGSSIVADFSSLIRNVHSIHLPTFILGTAAIVPLFLMRKRFSGFPSVALVVFLSILTSYLIDFKGKYGGAVVGFIPSSLPSLAFPRFAWDEASSLFGGALMIALIGFMEVLATTKAIAAKTKEKLNFNQELIGQGLAKMSCAIVHTFPVSGSFSRSALNLFAGAKTGLSSIFAGLFVLLSLFFLAVPLSYLPKAVLAGVIVVAVSGLIDFKPMKRIWRVNRFDGFAAWATFLFSILLAPRVTEGVLIGAGFSIAFHLVNLMKPHVAFLAIHPDGTFRDAAKHNLRSEQGIMIIRFEGRLVFANASHFEETVLDAISESPDTKAIIFQADSINEIDATGEETLRTLISELQKNRISVAVSEAKWRIFDTLRKADFFKTLHEEKFFRTTGEAYNELRKNLAH